ncbi:Rieske 2Fe-2S domain-containing protein [Variovorax sp. KK3]|uniref:Rieske 2Fe-2S domain-containing protein n=1 Tax=Variovorax sp. KK3 TaxID=1855728 RepID=UPI00097C372E|nr:Rieske 2Fe-2S domain-containing protein [Variovorax sp. KK3]
MNPRDNERLTDVSPGTPMHALCSRYWLPAGLASDLPEPDGAPIRVRLLGRNLVAFRDSDGQVGMLDELCPHRRASLMLGQVRRGTIECIYHGWRFSVDGSIVEMPNCDDERLKQRYRANAYPVKEAGGFLWVYLGPKDAMPEFPMHEWMALPERNRHPRIIASRSNFVQVMEGLLDTTHLGVLHQDSLPRADGTVKVVNNTTRPASRFTAVSNSAKVPVVEVEERSFGIYAAAIREGMADGEAVRDVRITAYVAPFTIYVANGHVTLMIVPVDTETTHLYIVYWDPEKPFAEEPYRSDIERGTGTLPEVAERWGFSRETLGAPGTMSMANHWGQDRARMASGESFSGLELFAMEDAACTSSMGTVSDRQEMLVPADLAIVRMRRFLLAAADAVARGEAPPAFADAEAARHVGAVHTQIAPGEDWREAVAATATTTEEA